MARIRFQSIDAYFEFIEEMNFPEEVAKRRREEREREEKSRIQDFYVKSCDKEARTYKKRYEKKEFNYRHDSWGSAEVAQCSMTSIYEAYEEDRRYEW